MLLEVVELLEPQNTHSRKSRRYSIHQAAVDAPEAGSHSVSCWNGVCFCQIVFAADLTEGIAFDHEASNGDRAGNRLVVGQWQMISEQLLLNRKVELVDGGHPSHCMVRLLAVALKSH